MKRLLSRILGVREDDVDAVVKHDAATAQRLLSRRGFLAAAAAIAGQVALPEPTTGSLIQLATDEQVVTYSFPAAGTVPCWANLVVGFQWTALIASMSYYKGTLAIRDAP